MARHAATGPSSRRRVPLRTAVRSLTGQSPMERLTLARATLVTALVEVGVRHLRLPSLARLVGVPLQLDGGAQAPHLAPPSFDATDRRRIRAVRRVIRHWPFGDGPCLRESLVLGHLLRRHRPVLRVGVARDGEQVLAHAWLEFGGWSLEATQAFLPFGAHGRHEANR